MLPFSGRPLSVHDVPATLLAQLPLSVLDRLCGATFDRATAYVDAFVAAAHERFTSRPETTAVGVCPAPMPSATAWALWALLESVYTKYANAAPAPKSVSTSAPTAVANNLRERTVRAPEVVIWWDIVRRLITCAPLS